MESSTKIQKYPEAESLDNTAAAEEQSELNLSIIQKTNQKQIEGQKEANKNGDSNMLRQWIWNQSRNIEKNCSSNLLSLADEQRLQRMKFEEQKKQQLLNNCQFDSSLYMQQFQKKRTRGFITQSQDFTNRIGSNHHLDHLSNKIIQQFPQSLNRKDREQMAAARHSQSIFMGDSNSRTVFTNQKQQNKQPQQFKFKKRDAYATISDAYSRYNSGSLQHDVSINSIVDSKKIKKDGSRSGAAFNLMIENGAQVLNNNQQIVGEAHEGIGSIADIDIALNTAFNISNEQQEVNPKLMNDIQKFNKRYLNQRQTNRLWIIEQRNNFLQSSRELASELKQTYNTARIVPNIDKIRRSHNVTATLGQNDSKQALKLTPRLSREPNSSLQVSPRGSKLQNLNQSVNSNRNEKNTRVHHYRSALHSLDSCVLDEIDEQFKQMKQNYQKYLLGDVDQNTLQDKFNKVTNPEFNKVYEKIKRAFKKIFVIKKGQQYINRNRKQITAKTKKQIKQEMADRQIQIWNDEIRKGKQMTGKSSIIDLEKGHKIQKDNLRRQELMLHPKQEDFLLFNQNCLEEQRDTSMLPQINTGKIESVQGSIDEAKITEQRKFPSVFSRLEQFQNQELVQSLKGVQNQFYQNEIKKAEEIVDNLRSGKLNKQERKEYKKQIVDYKNGLKEQINAQTFTHTYMRFEKLREIDNLAQEDILLTILTREVIKQCSIDLSKDQKLSDLALLMSKKPTKEQQEYAEKQKNKDVDEYISDLKSGKVFPGKKQIKLNQKLMKPIDTSLSRSMESSDLSLSPDMKQNSDRFSPIMESSSTFKKNKDILINIQESNQDEIPLNKKPTLKIIPQLSPNTCPKMSPKVNLKLKNLKMSFSTTQTSEESSIIGGDNELNQEGSQNNDEDENGNNNSNKNIDKIIGNRFQNLTEKGKKMLTEDINQLRGRIANNQTKKQMMVSELQANERRQEAGYLFFWECVKKYAPDLPLLNLIFDFQLVAKNYVLRKEHCQAFETVLQKTADCSKLFHSVHFDTNDLDDDGFAYILKGLNYLKNIQRIEYFNNKLGSQSIIVIQSLLLRPLPFQLREISLRNCQTTFTENQQLLKLFDETCSLQKLSLQQFCLNSDNIDQLVQYLITNKHLQRFTLSWSKLTFKNFQKISQAVCASRQLQDIDLQWNTFADTLLKQYQNSEEKSLAFASLFQKQIKYNKKLMHLNLSGLGLNQIMANQIISTLKNSLSLVCLHMSGNPFLEDIDLEELRNEAKAKPKDVRTPFIQPNNLIQAHDFKEMLIHNRLQMMKGVKRTEPNINEPFLNEMLVFHRKVGHKDELPGQGQWEVLSGKERPLPVINPPDPRNNPLNQNRQLNDDLLKQECWNCNYHSYSLVFWSHSIWQAICTKFADLQDSFALDYAKKLLKPPEAKMAIFKPQKYKPLPFFKGFISQSSSLSKVSESLSMDEHENMSDLVFQKMNVSKLVTPIISQYHPRLGQSPNARHPPKNLVLIQDSQEMSKTQQKLHLPPRIRYTMNNLNFQEDEPQCIEFEKSKHSILQQPLNKQLTMRSNDLIGKQKQFALPKFPDSGTLFESPPRVYSQYSNWKPIEMYELFEFCHLLKKRSGDPPPDFIQILKDKGKLPSGVENEDELDPIQTQYLYQEQQLYEQEFRRKWANQIIKYNRFKQANVVNYELAVQAVNLGEPVWVIPMFMRPGKQSLFFHHAQSYTSHRIAIQTCIINLRQEKIPHFLKVTKNDKKNNAFNHDGSVFAQWRDNNRIFEQHDFSKWKIDRFIKRPHEQRLIRQFFLDNIQHIKEIYANMQAISNLYPGISGQAFSEFCQMSGLIDKQFSLSTADRLFIAANFDANDDSGDNSANELIRYELLEILVRVAKVKYIDTGICSNAGEALELLLDKIISQCQLIPWESWRQTQLWTADVNNMFSVNNDALRKVFALIGRVQKPKRVSYEHFHYFFVTAKEPALYEIKLFDRQFKKCYAFSKMPVLNEDHELDIYNSLLFVEFLEFLGRMAEVKYQDTPMIQEEPLVTRIGYLLDSLFEIVGEQRRDSSGIEGDETVTDDDY